MDTLTPRQRSERMSRIRAKDTKPEIVVRRMTHGLGFRFRLHSRKLPGCPDLVFSRRRKVIFVHGCFWHRHKKCCNDRPPKTKLDFWLPKLNGNRKRDVKNQIQLRKMGWDFLIIWECELKNKEKLSKRIVDYLEDKK
ncbi:MAG: very short patch repair endonuclease [Nitrospinales bacterium]